MGDKEKRENIATCSPTKAMAQCYKISEKLKKWLVDTDIIAIRNRVPELLDIEKIPDDATDEEKKRLRKDILVKIAENKMRSAEQMKENFFSMVSAICGEHPDETTDLLAMCCFVEPEKKDDYPMSFYMDAVSDIIENESVLRFFGSLVRLAAKL